MLLSEYQDRPVPIDMSGLNFNRYSDKGKYTTWYILLQPVRSKLIIIL